MIHFKLDAKKLPFPFYCFSCIDQSENKIPCLPLAFVVLDCI